MSRPTFAEVISSALTARLARVHTMLPGRIESYDAEKQVADVQPLVQALAQDEDGSRLVETLPVLPAIPVVFPGAGGFRATYPVQVGDTVMVLFAEASLDIWQDRGGLVDPKDTRRHHLSDAVAVVGLHDNKTPWTGAATDAATWGKDGGPQVVARDGGLELGATADSPPSDALVLGTTYRAAEDAFLTALIQALTTAVASLTTAIGQLAVPTVGGSLATPSLTTVVAQLQAIQQAATTYKGAGATDYLSEKVKTA